MIGASKRSGPVRACRREDPTHPNIETRRTNTPMAAAVAPPVGRRRRSAGEGGRYKTFGGHPTPSFAAFFDLEAVKCFPFPSVRLRFHGFFLLFFSCTNGIPHGTPRQSPRRTNQATESFETASRSCLGPGFIPSTLPLHRFGPIYSLVDTTPKRTTVFHLHAH